MNSKKKPEFNFGKLIESYRWPIGVGLLVLILFLGSYLLWRENYWKAGQTNRIVNYESRITNLEDKIVELEQAKTEAQAASQATPVQPTADGAVAGASTSSSAPAAQPKSGKININTATASELDSLPGIGPAYAGRIIDYRNQHGGFKSIEEVKNVKGIGDKTFDKFKDRITI